jgi:hypothetical protein
VARLNANKIYAYFRQFYGLRSKPSPKGWYEFDCPLCGGEKKRAVHTGMGLTKCWTCSFSGNVVEFVALDSGCTEYEAEERIRTTEASRIDLAALELTEKEKVVYSEVKLPKGFHSLLNGDTTLAKRARKYLEKDRGFDIERLDRKGYGYCNKHFSNDPDINRENINRDFFGYIVVPFRKDGLLQYYQGRDYVGNFLRHKNPPSDYVGIGKSEVLYNEDALYLYDEVSISEGWADAETWGDSGTATLGWSLSPYQKQMYFKADAHTLVFIPDAGVNGQGELFYHLALRAARDFIDSGKNLYVVDLNDPLLCYPDEEGKPTKKDVNEIGRKPVRDKYKEDTPRLTWSNINKLLDH